MVKPGSAGAMVGGVVGKARGARAYACCGAVAGAAKSTRLGRAKTETAAGDLGRAASELDRCVCVERTDPVQP